MPRLVLSWFFYIRGNLGHAKEKLIRKFCFSSIVLEVMRTVLFFYQDILHKNKTPKYLNMPKYHNEAHSLGKKCLHEIADKKNNQ